MVVPGNNIFVVLLEMHVYQVTGWRFLFSVQVLREFNHVNPQNDEDGKVFSDTRVSDLPLHGSLKEFYDGY